MVKRRLDFITEKRQLVKDILSLGGDADLGSLSDEVTSFGDSLQESLESMSLPRLRRIHAKIITGELPVNIREDEF
jgi:hypothetical protein